MDINVIGAGLAGCEAAWQVALKGLNVNLFDMKPSKFSQAHKNANFAELVCSNSLKAMRLDSAAGLLKEEMRRLNSLLLDCAEICRVPAGGALAVDRNKFAQLVTNKIKNNPCINVIEKEVTSLPEESINIIATGPLTSDLFSEYINEICGGFLSFFDAASPIVTKDSIDFNSAFFASRYNKGEDDAYINCPMNEQEYELFYNALVSADVAILHNFDKKGRIYDGCMPVEIMASKGKDTLRFGPLKPVGLIDPHTGKRLFAVVQLRRENLEGNIYNLVGFQTNLKFNEQKRVFSMIPALKCAEFVRYGVMHRNTFINSPHLLNADFNLRNNKKIFFAGQITGVEGYMESASSGIVAGINAARAFLGNDTLIFPKETMIGALSNYISDSNNCNFQPMGANFGILPKIVPHIRNKKDRYNELSKRSLDILDNYILKM